ncbi:MAG: N-acetyltransferase [Alphaproteobacteria bacterium]|nr:N-acetyltransferase [Alphaproteobacteria bacterium]
MVAYREEEARDRPGIRAANWLAFGGGDEVLLIDRLWADGLVIVSLVAVDGHQVVGHILFSRLAIETAHRTVRAAALAPLAVLPERQRERIGSALVERGIEACREDGIEAIVVVGHEDFYPRFGFSAITAERLRAPFSGPAFMALELVSGALAVDSGTVRYPPAFRLENATADT